MIIDGKNYLTTKEAAERLKVSGGRVRQLVAEGVIGGRKIGNTNFVSTEDVTKYSHTRQPRGRKPGYSSTGKGIPGAKSKAEVLQGVTEGMRDALAGNTLTLDELWASLDADE